jgi:hypothetical protein
VDGEVDGEADGVAEGDGEAVGEAGRAVVAEPVRSGVVVRLETSIRAGGGGSSGSVRAKESAMATNTAARTQTGASRNTSGTIAHGRSHPARAYQRSAATTTTAAAISHHGYPRLSTPTPPPGERTTIPTP